MGKIKLIIKSVQDFVPKLVIPWRLPKWYIKLFILGLILIGLNYSYLPNLTYCSNLFEANFCSPWGVYLIAFISFPGYLVINAILPEAAIVNDSLYSLIVFVTSLLVYSLLNFLYSKRNHVKLSSTGFVYLVFLSLLFALLVLIFLSRG